MSAENGKPSEGGPEAREAMTNLRDGLERAHEIVAEHKLALRQIGEEPALVPEIGPVNPTD